MATQEIDPTDALRASFETFKEEVFDEIKNLMIAQVRLEQSMAHVAESMANVHCLKPDKFAEIDRRLAEVERDVDDERREKRASWWKLASVVVGFVAVIVSGAIAFGSVQNTADSNKDSVNALVRHRDNIAPRMTRVETRQGSLMDIASDTRRRLSNIEKGVSAIKSDVRSLKERR